MKMNNCDTWFYTSRNEPRGYIQPQTLEELWFHTGTSCNLRCPCCLEGSQPGDSRLEFLTLDDVRSFIDEALELGVKTFSFTGGEPFVNPDFLEILALALEHRPCLVLTNATEPLIKQMAEVQRLRDKPHALKFRISLDDPDPVKHDALRGKGTFDKALTTLGILYKAGFSVSVARRMTADEDSADVDKACAKILRTIGIAEDITIVKFPEFHLPGSLPHVPEITKTCMTRYLTARQRERFMCNFSKMVVRKDGRCGVYACTLVDDNKSYDLGSTLKSAMQKRVMLGHHRCYSCFACGTSCSEGD
jgi:molybdenum cofactor biosynthesis enzyme MoaA